jgi:peptidoglycan/xylan/chitin deacetylase (PgdA/CDA1 family)
LAARIAAILAALLLVVNFHYVAERAPAAARAIFPVSVGQLTAQVSALAQRHEPVSRDQIVSAVEDGAPLPESAVLVTFDDGLRAQAELALPALQRLGVPALFFVSGRPHAERRALHVHRVHHLRESLDRAAFGTLLEKHLATLRVAVPKVSDRQAQAMYRYDDPPAAREKYLLNVALDREASERVVEAMFAEIGPDEDAFCHDLYMSDEQVRELEHAYGAIGAHGYDHHPFAALDPAAKVADMARGARALETITGRRPHTISYPYGSAAAVTRDVGAAAAGLGFSAGFTMERSVNLSLDEPLLLGRIDTNDAPGGRQPIDDLRPRARYFDEAGAVAARA